MKKELWGVLAIFLLSGIGCQRVDNPGGADAASDIDSDGDTDTDGDTDSDSDIDTDDCLWGEFFDGDHSIFNAASLAELKGYVGVDGTLTVMTLLLEDLDGLYCLAEVTGDLILLSNYEMISFNGLQQLETVNGDLHIAKNDFILNLSELGNIQTIGARLIINENEALEDIDALFNLTFLGGNLSITGNPNLATCQAENLREYLVSIGWSGNATISGNNSELTCED